MHNDFHVTSKLIEMPQSKKINIFFPSKSLNLINSPGKCVGYNKQTFLKHLNKLCDTVSAHSSVAWSIAANRAG